MNRLLMVLMLVTLPEVACNSDSVRPATTTKPNIVLIIADDLGWDVMGNYPGINGVKANTPTLDSLAQNGVTFLNNWVNPVCAPTRASLLTGKYAFRTGVGGVQVPQTAVLQNNEVIIQKFIKQQTSNAYATAIIGKWHVSSNTNLTAPEDFGVDYYAGIFSGAVSDYYNWTETSNGKQQTITTYATTHFVNNAIDWVNKQNKPFFLWLAFNAPHTPFHLPPTSLIANKSLSSSSSAISSNPYPYYLASIEAMDKELSRFINSLTKSQKQNTVFIFLGDNGTPYQVSQAPYDGDSKGTLFQGGVNTPLIICGSGVSRKNETETALVQNTDIFATIAEIAGTSTVEYADGVSLLPLCNSASATKRDFVYTEQFGQESVNDGYAIRNGTYKLIHLTDGSEFFYNLSADPFEQTNLLLNTLSTIEQENYSSLKSIKNNF